MFTLPPLPPKDYALKGVAQNQLSSQEFTPDSLPRSTQSNLGLYCAPIEYSEEDTVEETIRSHSATNERIIRQYLDHSKAFWVDKPGKNAPLLHHIYNKYNVDEGNYDHTYKPKERVFYRPYQYEFDYKEQVRLKKLEDKVCREVRIKELAKKKKKEVRRMELKAAEVTCTTNKPPFWWKGKERTEESLGTREDEEHEEVGGKNQLELEVFAEEKTERWQEEPDFMAPAKSDYCQRRKDMAL